MFVKHWMTHSPKTVSEQATLADVLSVLRNHKLRRLPVDAQGSLRGLITDAQLSSCAGMAVLRMPEVPEEIVAALAAQEAADVMIRRPFTCGPNTPLEEAAELMRREKIGVLPVVHNGKIEGIITESDVLRALIEITSLHSNSHRVYFQMPAKEKFEVFYKIVELCELHGLEVLSLLTHALHDEGTHIVMLRYRGQQAEDFVQALRENQYPLLKVE